MRTLILVKHAMPEKTADVPARDWSLSNAGREKSRTLAQELTAYTPQTIISSTEPKAMQTAEIVAEMLHIPYCTFPNLHEHDRSNVLANDGQEQFEAKVQALFDRPNDLVYGLETGNAALRRFSHAIDSALDQFPVETLVVVAHGTVISLYLASVCGLDPFPLWKSLQLPSYVVLQIPENTLLSITPMV